MSFSGQFSLADVNDDVDKACSPVCPRNLASWSSCPHEGTCFPLTFSSSVSVLRTRSHGAPWLLQCDGLGSRRKMTIQRSAAGESCAAGVHNKTHKYLVVPDCPSCSPNAVRSFVSTNQRQCFGTCAHFLSTVSELFSTSTELFDKSTY